MNQSILLHACCGPCAIAPVQRLRQAGFGVTALFVNPNIHPLSEYLRRREAMEECARRMELPVIWRDDLWNLKDWLRGVVGQGQGGDEGETRCSYCYDTRLRVTAHMAADRGFDCFTSSLLYSRHQRHQLISQWANEHAQTHAISFHYVDFREDWQKGIDISKEWGVYRQPYCGCIYSEAERYKKKLQKLLLNA